VRTLGFTECDVKNTEDEYEIRKFDLKDGKILCRGEEGTKRHHIQEGGTETYCSRCAWHGRLTAS